MSPVEATVLGVVQGLTEFLPISSTAHLRVIPALLGWNDPGAAYSAVIQLGSVLAVLTYFWRDMSAIVTGSFKALRQQDITNKDVRLLGAILLGTVPICILGLVLKEMLERPDSPLRALIVVGTASICMALLLVVAERKGSHRRHIDTISVKDGVLVGLGQCLALIPGCSRSGSTLTVAMLLDLKRDEAARFSFLLGIPALVLSGLLELKELLNHGLDSAGKQDLIIGLIASTIVSYISIGWLLKFLQNHSTWFFVIYRLIFGVLVIALASLSLIK